MSPEDELEARNQASNRRSPTLVKYGDKLIPLGERLDQLEKRINVVGAIVVMLGLDQLVQSSVAAEVIKLIFGAK